MNCVRKHLSAIKGGRLAAAAAPARVITLAISDVPGDDPAVIASGPTVPDRTTFADARAIIARYGITPVARRGARAWQQPTDETPKPADLPNTDFRLIATPIMCCARWPKPRAPWPDAADPGRRAGRRGGAGGHPVRRHRHAVATHGQPIAPPAVLLSGGETTVTIGRGPAGRGGRNTEFRCRSPSRLSGAPRIWAAAGDTDGIDGTEDAAGAIVTPDTLARARAVGLDPRAVLTGHDSYSLFAAIGDLIVTGPTLTNVNDIRILLIA